MSAELKEKTVANPGPLGPPDFGVTTVLLDLHNAEHGKTVLPLS